MNLPDAGWHLLTEHGRNGRDYRLNPKDGSLTMVWESDGFRGPIAKTLDDFTPLAELAEWCDDCRKWAVPAHAFYYDMTDLTHGGFWRVRRPHLGRA